MRHATFLRTTSTRAGVVSLLALAIIASLADTPAVARRASVPRFSSALLPKVGVDPTRIVAADLNADGRPDLATADWTSSTVSVLLGRGTGSFQRRTAYRSARHPAGITASDLDGDGDQDLVSASVDRAGSISVYLNQRSGRFARAVTYRSGANAYAVAAADVNHDATVDLVTANYTRQHLAVLLGQGAGRFGPARSYAGVRATDVALGDLNGDGNLDAAVATASSVAVHLGGGDGTFGPAQTYKFGSGPFGLTLADLNHDRALDIAVANYGGGTVSVLPGTGRGTFAAGSKYPMGDGFNVDAVVVADFDRDGNLDIATPELFGPVVRRGRGDGTFPREQRVGSPDELPTQGGTVADFNGDGWADLAFSGTCDWSDCSFDRAIVLLNWTGQPAPPCVLPHLVGRRLRDANRELAADGCRLGRVGRRYSRKVRKGRVITQRPRWGGVRPSHASVDVVISRGRRR